MQVMQIGHFKALFESKIEYCGRSTGSKKRSAQGLFNPQALPHIEMD